MDGEDIVQEALFDAYRRLDTYDDSRPISPWLFKIAHNRCIDFLRKRGVQMEAEAVAAGEPMRTNQEHSSDVMTSAIECLVIELPPMERACVLLKEIFEYSLQETADLVGSTVGGVKAALHRGRSKLARLSDPPSRNPVSDPELNRLLRLYVDCFNGRDWDGLRELITDDARLRVADRYWGSLSQAPYFGIYERMQVPWSMVVGEAEGRAVVICQRLIDGAWKSESVIRVECEGDRISRVVDYLHCRWVFDAMAADLRVNS